MALEQLTFFGGWPHSVVVVSVPRCAITGLAVLLVVVGGRASWPGSGLRVVVAAASRQPWLVVVLLFVVMVAIGMVVRRWPRTQHVEVARKTNKYENFSKYQELLRQIRLKYLVQNKTNLKFSKFTFLMFTSLVHLAFSVTERIVHEWNTSSFPVWHIIGEKATALVCRNSLISQCTILVLLNLSCDF